MIKLVHSLNLPEAAKQLPTGRNGRPVSTSTLVRWITRGLIGPDGSVVRLAAVRLGSRWVTDEEALQQFVQNLTPRLTDSPTTKFKLADRRSAEHADSELEKRGF